MPPQPKVLAYLDERQVPYQRIDLETAVGQQMMAQYAMRSSPGILVDGMLVNPFDILELPACQILEPQASQIFGIGTA